MVSDLLFLRKVDDNKRKIENNMLSVWKLRGKAEAEPFFMINRFKKMRNNHKLFFIALTNYWREHFSLIPKTLFYKALRFYLGSSAIYDKAKRLEKYGAVVRVGDYFAFNFAPSRIPMGHEYKEFNRELATQIVRLILRIREEGIEMDFPRLKKWIAQKTGKSTKTISNYILLLVRMGVIVPKIDGLHIKSDITPSRMMSQSI